MSQINPRYAAYAQAHGRSPSEMLIFDRGRCPGGHMAEFIIWIGQKWSLWRTQNMRRRDDPLSDADHANFDAWLRENSLSICVASRPDLEHDV